MRLRIFALVVMFFALIAFGMIGEPVHSAQKVVIKGSTTVLPITMKAIEAYKKKKPDVAVSLEGSGSGNGIKSLLEGSCDIANSSREMKKEELSKAKAASARIKEIVVAWDMIVPIVNPANPVSNLTLEQLKAIYDGSITNWKALGGKDEKIVVISRDTSSGTYEYWHEFVMKKTDVRRDALLQASSGAVVSGVAMNRKAIAYVGFGYLNKNVKAVNVNGVTPNLENGKTKKYAIARELYMYVNEGKYSQAAKDFVAFLLSAEGQGIVKAAGYIPLR